MKSIANQYRDLKEGRMSQANFMRNLRMMMPQHVTNVTSFNDAIRILKSKSILTEAMDIQPVPEADEEFKSDDAETQAMIDKIEKEMAGEEAVKAQYDITEAKEKLHPNQIHPQELRMGIQVEMEHTKDAEKAKKIALDHLAENPFYYTQLKLSGVDVKATPSKEKKAVAKKKDETELVDKANQMKPVKGVEKAKASANKATKETNKPVKGISLMSLIAKTARGVQKMTATGEKMKVVREGQENYYQTNVRLKPEEQKKIKSVLLDAEFEWDEDDRKQVVYSKKSEKEIQNVVDNVTGMATPSSGPKQSGVAKFLTKEDLAEMVREVLAEMESDDEVTADVALGMDETMDGRDNLTDTAGHQLDENKLKKYYAVFNLHGDFNNGVPLYIITDTKEEMVNKLNKIYLELTGEKQAPYSIEDMEDDVYMGKKLDHFISDDWASVTNNEQVFKNDISHLKIPPTKID